MKDAHREDKIPYRGHEIQAVVFPRQRDAGYVTIYKPDGTIDTALTVDAAKERINTWIRE